MKIRTDNQQPPVAQQALERQPEQRETAAPEAKGGKVPRRQDSVELSAALDAELRKQEAEQAGRVASIKSQLEAGEYRVSSRDVAEKILSGRLDK